MNYTTAACGHPVIAVGAPGSGARSLVECEVCQSCKIQQERDRANAPHPKYCVCIKCEAARLLAEAVEIASKTDLTYLTIPDLKRRVARELLAALSAAGIELRRKS